MMIPSASGTGEGGEGGGQPGPSASSSGGKKKKCLVPGCANGAKRGGLCIAHGGGIRCSIPDCKNSAVGAGKCIAHGGGKKCNYPGCDNSARSRGLCPKHGGGTRCSVEGCTKHVVAHGRCVSHGGRRQCRVEGCQNTARRGGLCGHHMGEVASHLPGPSAALLSHSRALVPLEIGEGPYLPSLDTTGVGGGMGLAGREGTSLPFFRQPTASPSTFSPATASSFSPSPMSYSGGVFHGSPRLAEPSQEMGFEYGVPYLPPLSTAGTRHTLGGMGSLHPSPAPSTATIPALPSPRPFAASRPLPSPSSLPYSAALSSPHPLQSQPLEYRIEHRPPTPPPPTFRQRSLSVPRGEEHERPYTFRTSTQSEASVPQPPFAPTSLPSLSTTAGGMAIGRGGETALPGLLERRRQLEQGHPLPTRSSRGADSVGEEAGSSSIKRLTSETVVVSYEGIERERGGNRDEEDKEKQGEGEQERESSGSSKRLNISALIA